jgi:hypothetical protein
MCYQTGNDRRTRNAALRQMRVRVQAEVFDADFHAIVLIVLLFESAQAT